MKSTAGTDTLGGLDVLPYDDKDHDLPFMTIRLARWGGPDSVRILNLSTCPVCLTEAKKNPGSMPGFSLSGSRVLLGEGVTGAVIPMRSPANCSWGKVGLSH